MKAYLCLFVIGLSLSLHIDAYPAGQSDISDSLRARLGDTLSEIEWLLHQLVNILSDMVDGIETEPNLLQNYHFRQILIQVIKRIDYILEHFENVGTSVLTPSVVYELQRIDCIRIRLANYISQSKKFDDSQCRPISDSNKPGHQPNNDLIVPLLTQIVSILVQITQQLNKLTTMKETMLPSTPNYNPLATTSTTAFPLWTKPASTINWEDLISQFVSSKPVTVPNTGQNPVTPAPIEGTTQNWADLISDVMDSMGGTLTPAVTGVTMPSNMTPTTPMWEDVMNDLIGQWTGSMSTSAPNNNIDVQQCVDSIMSIINTIQNQLPNGTLPSTQN